MPATESTWRNMPLMHRIFAISGVILTLATLWMFYKDHVRSWKAIQPQVVDIDLAMNRWRQEQFETTEALLQQDSLSQALATALAQPLDAALLGKFKAAVQADKTDARSLVGIEARQQRLLERSQEATKLRAEATAALAAAEKKPTDDSLAAAARAANAKAEDAEERAAEERTRLVKDLQSLVDAAKIREDKILDDRKAVSGKIDAAKAQYDIAIRDDAGQEELARRQQAVDDLVRGRSEGDKSSFNYLNEQYQKLSAHRKQLEKLLKQMTAAADAAKKSYDDNLANLERLKTQFQQQEETYVKFAWGVVPSARQEDSDAADSGCVQLAAQGR